MLFCSREFLIFFAVVFTAYWALPWPRARVWLLCGASVFFYASWNRWLALIVCASTALDFAIARVMDRSTNQRLRRALLALSVGANLGLLCYFKYVNFFLHSVEQALHAAGQAAHLPVLKVLLPIGISFYTFEAISYTVDVYRRRIRAETNLMHFLLFITFFPHLVAGPIVRARDFLPQVRRIKRWDWARLHVGLLFILVGFVKKAVIADRMAMFSDPVFANPGQFSSGAAWAAMIAYAIQIYCDFSGYSDMALGTAHMLGYKLSMNFNLPYMAANVSEFWHRWHISLSTWLRDYVYIPLGGSRAAGTERRRNWLTNRNLLATMLLGGLWHGAAWTFVVWGLLHGLMLVGHRTFAAWCGQRPGLGRALRTLPGTAARIGLTFLCVSLAWVFFRAATFAQAWAFLRRLAPSHVGARPLAYHSLVTLALVVLVCHLLMYANVWRRLAERVPAHLLGAGYAAVATLALVLAPETGKVFIYFQF